MTVAELIRELQKYPPELTVVTEGYEDGYDNVVDVIEIKITPAANPSWYVGTYDRAENDNAESVVFINGNNKMKALNEHVGQ